MFGIAVSAILTFNLLGTSFKDFVGWIEISIASIGIKFSNKAVLVPKTDGYKFEIKKFSCLKKGTNYNAV